MLLDPSKLYLLSELVTTTKNAGLLSLDVVDLIGVHHSTLQKLRQDCLAMRSHPAYFSAIPSQQGPLRGSPALFNPAPEAFHCTN